MAFTCYKGWSSFLSHGNKTVLYAVINQNLFRVAIMNAPSYVQADSGAGRKWKHRLYFPTSLYKDTQLAVIVIKTTQLAVIVIMHSLCTCFPTVQPETNLLSELPIRREDKIKI